MIIYSLFPYSIICCCGGDWVFSSAGIVKAESAENCSCGPEVASSCKGDVIRY